MKRDYILGVLLFGGLWGVSEATLGDVLYRNGIPQASVPLTVIGVAILAFAAAHLPRPGTATLIASCAMLYKFLNTPLFACHLLGIFLTGVWYDLFLNVTKITNRRLAAALTVYGSYASFALLITYVFRYEHWVQGGFGKLLGHVGVGGSVAALICAAIAPAAFYLGEAMTAKALESSRWRTTLRTRSLIGATAVLWLFDLAQFMAYTGVRG
ncbi:MAG: hypothetical protein JSW27_04550 [Phycisphaerales bacterium]|nr:MAG: hypothetical protein JSW27_04550 [Phycisphaerales bacterium]